MVVLAIHYIQVVWEVGAVHSGAGVHASSAGAGNSELGFYFQVFLLLSVFQMKFSMLC